jgi:hypothetical protein
MTPPIPEYKARYTERDFDPLGFHDCRITGIEWNDEAFELTLFIQYILQWVPQGAGEISYAFWISPTTLTFRNVEDPEVILQWHRLSLDCVIFNLVKGNSRPTPNGVDTYYWTFELSEPNGSITLWATGFELKVLQPPTLCDIPRLAQPPHKTMR